MKPQITISVSASQNEAQTQRNFAKFPRRNGRILRMRAEITAFPFSAIQERGGINPMNQPSDSLLCILP